MTFSPNAGFGYSAVQTFTIGNGADGSAVAVVDLGRPYAYVLVVCTDVTNAPAGTVTPYVAAESGGTPVRLYEQGVEATQPLDNPFHRMFFAGRARDVRLIMSANASGGSVVFSVYGVDAGLE